MTGPADSHVRLLIGPVNSAGQADAWARAVTAYTEAEARSFGFVRPWARRRDSLSSAFPVDVRLPHPRLTPRAVQAAALRRLTSGASHLAIDSFAALLHRLDRSHIGAELERILATRPGLHVAFVAHGSDLRDPRGHMERLDDSYYRLDPEWSAHLGGVAARNRKTVSDTGLPLFVSTPDLLLEDVPAVWLPLTVDPRRWAGSRPPMLHRTPTVLHLPSRREPPIKGSDVIDPVLAALERAGRITYLRPGKVAPVAVPDLVRAADIVVEQVRSGYYSTQAVEAMAAGRVVISSLAEDVRDLMPEAPPLVATTVAGLRGALEEVLTDRNAAVELASRGPDYVGRWHDGQAAAARLTPWLGLEPRS